MAERKAVTSTPRKYHRSETYDQPLSAEQAIRLARWHQQAERQARKTINEHNERTLGKT